MSCWVHLGIDATKDQNAIRLAYRTRLPDVHPETDSQGFQALRSAYEDALAFARQADSPDLEEDGDEPEQPHPALVEFERMLGDPEQRFMPAAWQGFIDHLDTLPLQDLDTVSWALLWRLRDAGPISHLCARLLATRLGWNQQLLRLAPDAARAVEDFLSEIEQPDPFDTRLMASWSLAAQLETLWYQRTLALLYQRRPLFELKQFALQHTVVAFPQDDALLERLLPQLTLADVATPGLHALCAERHEQAPDDVDRLYLLARQASGLGLDERALACWARLWLEHQHPQAARALLDLCQRHEPQHLPVLIQALDCLQPFDDWPEALGDARQHVGSPGERPETLARWWEAARLELGGIAGAFVTWRHAGDELPLLAWLLDDDSHTDPQRLYRYAWALHRGDTALLQQVVQAPDSDNLLESLILQGLRRQAEQRLTWLRRAPICLAMAAFCASDEADVPLPPALTDTRGVCRDWLRRLRAYDARACAHLARTFTFKDMMPVPFALGTQAELAASGVLLPPVPISDDPWPWHRQALFLLALVDQPQRWLERVTPTMLAALQCDATHPLAPVQAQLAHTWQANGNLDGPLRWPDRHDPLQRLLAERMPPPDGDLGLDGERLPSSDSLFHTYAQQATSVREDLIGTLLFLATLYHDPVLSAEQHRDLLAEINTFTCAEPWFEGLHADLIKGQPQPAPIRKLNALGTDGGLFLLILRSLTGLNQSGVDGVPTWRALKQLQQAKDNPGTSAALRLAATAVLTRCERLLGTRADLAVAPSWAIWKWQSRLNRTDFIGHVLFWPLLAVLPPILVTLPTGLSIVVAVIGLLGACLRRLRDMGQGVPAVVALSVVSLITLLAPLVLLVIPGDPLPNRYGPPPSKTGENGLKGGLQANLRRLGGMAFRK